MFKIEELNFKRLYWKDIKHKVELINRPFFELIEQVEPDEHYPLYQLNFPYGKILGDELSQFILTKQGKEIRMTDSALPTILVKELGYGLNTSPVGMVLDKNVEWYIDLPHKQITLPVMLQSPGDFFSYTKLLDFGKPFNYSPMGILSVRSGLRSVFMLPSIACQTKLLKLSRELGVKLRPPQNLYQQFELFQVISTRLDYNYAWESSVLYFSEKWVESIKYNPEWFAVQKYFYKLFSLKSLYTKNLPYFQTAYSYLLERANLKPNPYLFDTFKHLIDMMVGETPGFAPILNNDAFPFEGIAKAFTNFYDLRGNIATIIGPNYLWLDQPHAEPIYYSMQYPTTRTYSPNSKQTSTLSAMKELRDMCYRFLNELTKSDNFCSNTIIQHIAKNIQVDFYHSSDDLDHEIDDIDKLIDDDPRFHISIDNNTQLTPAKDSKFFRGCIKLGYKKG